MKRLVIALIATVWECARLGGVRSQAAGVRALVAGAASSYDVFVAASGSTVLTWTALDPRRRRAAPSQG